MQTKRVSSRGTLRHPASSHGAGQRAAGEATHLEAFLFPASSASSASSAVVLLTTTTTTTAGCRGRCGRAVHVLFVLDLEDVGEHEPRLRHVVHLDHSADGALDPRLVLQPPSRRMRLVGDAEQHANSKARTEYWFTSPPPHGNQSVCNSTTESCPCHHRSDFCLHTAVVRTERG
jgi:hypothetical protein